MSASVTKNVTEYLEGELESHACSICYEMMEGADRAPMLLIPCGHSMCKYCLNHHIHTNHKKTCPLCRAPIQSSAVNISLQQLIQSMSAKRMALKQSQKQREAMGSELAEDETDVTKYIQQFHQYSLRCAVLSTKLEDLTGDKETIARETEACRLVEQHLIGEENSIEERMRSLQTELDFVRSHLDAQRTKAQELQANLERIEQTENNVKNLLTPLERERDKAQLIVQRLAPHVQLSLPTVERKQRQQQPQDQIVESSGRDIQTAHLPSNQTTAATTTTEFRSTAAAVPNTRLPSASSSSSTSAAAAARPTSNAPAFTHSTVPWPFPANPPKYYNC